MPKKTKSKKTKTSQPKVDPKNSVAQIPVAQVIPEPTLVAPKPERLIRAIAVTREVLDAAKAYKRAHGVSFYQLGLEAISERLEKEGYLNRPAEPKPKSQGEEIAKA